MNHFYLLIILSSLIVSSCSVNSNNSIIENNKSKIEVTEDLSDNLKPLLLAEFAIIEGDTFEAGDLYFQVANKISDMDIIKKSLDLNLERKEFQVLVDRILQLDSKDLQGLSYKFLFHLESNEIDKAFEYLKRIQFLDNSIAYSLIDHLYDKDVFFSILYKKSRDYYLFNPSNKNAILVYAKFLSFDKNSIQLAYDLLSDVNSKFPEVAASLLQVELLFDLKGEEDVKEEMKKLLKLNKNDSLLSERFAINFIELEDYSSAENILASLKKLENFDFLDRFIELKLLSNDTSKVEFLVNYLISHFESNDKLYADLALAYAIDNNIEKSKKFMSMIDEDENFLIKLHLMFLEGQFNRAYRILKLFNIKDKSLVTTLAKRLSKNNPLLALNLVESFLKINKGNESLLDVYISICIKLGQYNKSLDIATILVKMYPNNSTYFKCLIYSLLELKRYDQALMYLNKGLDIFDHNDVNLLDSLGLFFLKNSDYLKSIFFLEKSLFIDRNENTVLYLVEDYQKLGNIEKAIEILNKYLIFFPRNIDIQNKLQELNLI